MLRAPFFTAFGTNSFPRKNVGDILGKLNSLMAQPLSHGTEDLEPSPSTKALPGTRFLCFHYFIPFTTALQSSFALAFLPLRRLSAGSGPFSLTTSSWEKDLSLPTSTRHQKQSCVPNMKGGTWCTRALSSSQCSRASFFTRVCSPSCPAILC